MASTLISNVNSASQHRANILTNSPNRVMVMVEDELDVVIWRRILSLCVPSMRFDVRPYSYDPAYHGKGKAQILAQSAGFGRHLIGCVDSDNDWLLEQWTCEGALISGSPYIFQTYAYSIENLAAQPYALSDCMTECCMHCCDLVHRLDEDCAKFVAALSEAVYDVLLWHLTMHKEQTDVDKISDGWNYLFGNGHYEDIHNDRTLTVEGKRRPVLERFSTRAAALVQRYEATYPALIQPRSTLEAELTSVYNLSTDNAYLFVRGHNLHDFLLHNFFSPVQNHVRNLHESEIQTHTVGQETGNAIRHYHSLLKDFGRDYIHRVDYMQDLVNPFSMRIKHDIEAVFNP